MNPRTSRFRARHPFSAAFLVLPLVLAGCSAAPAPAGPPPAAADMGHVHAISVDPASTKILLATHTGLYDATDGPAVKVGESGMDLMGFTATADPNVFYASGHPGPGSALPNPLGLIRSDDGGTTWQQLSRAGESDFHALTVSGHSLVAFDGELRTSPDGVTWTTSPASFAPAVLAGSPASTVVLATTENGLQRSTDSGATWQAVEASPIIQFAAMAASTEKAPTEAVGVTPGGSVHVSTDTGLTWAAAGTISGQVQAVAAVAAGTGPLRIWAATTTGVQVSTDGGATFHAATS